MMRSDFCVLILSHGRPNNVKTLKTLNSCGYDGDWYIVIDNEDNTRQKYIDNFGEDRVVEFDKKAISNTFDAADLSDDRRTIVYARNASFEIAKNLGYQYFIELDDDYTDFMHRFIEDGKLKGLRTKNIGKVFHYLVEFLNDSGAASVAMAQGGDLIGGASNRNFYKQLLRKAMNSFVCDVDRPFQFVGRINEDVNTYVSLGNRGVLFFTYPQFALTQTTTQKSSGGMSGVYLDSGTYLKSFYTVMMCPSCVSVREMGDKHRRLHHHVNWGCAVPKILRSEYGRKE